MQQHHDHHMQQHQDHHQYFALISKLACASCGSFNGCLRDFISHHPIPCFPCLAPIDSFIHIHKHAPLYTAVFPQPLNTSKPSKLILSIPSLSLNSTLGILPFTVTFHIHLTILISFIPLFNLFFDHQRFAVIRHQGVSCVKLPHSRREGPFDVNRGKNSLNFLQPLIYYNFCKP